MTANCGASVSGSPSASPLAAVGTWDVPHASAAVVAADGEIATAVGDVDRRYRLASVTKIVTGWTCMIAVEEGIVALDDPVGQDGCTLHHLLAHAGGYAFNGHVPITSPGRRRIYSNTGIEMAADHVGERAGLPFARYLAEAVLDPLGWSERALDGSPAFGLYGTVRDLTRLLGELMHPKLLSADGAAAIRSTQYPDLAGIVPGVGRFDPCPWGLGVEIRGEKSPHWTGTTNAPETFGHFGAAGTMAWVDPVASCGVVALTDRRYDEWPAEALAAWSSMSDAVISEYGTSTP